MLTADYIVGLTDGEGCFLVQIRTDYREEVWQLKLTMNTLHNELRKNISARLVPEIGSLSGNGKQL